MAAKRRPRKSTKKSARRSTRKGGLRRLIRRLLPVFLLAVIALIAYAFHLDVKIRSQFEGKRWTLPAKVYARPLELYPGRALLQGELLAELRDLDYFRQTSAVNTGSYDVDDAVVIVHTRPFKFIDGQESSQRLKIHFSGQYVQAIENMGDGLPRSLVRLDPVQIASIYPTHNEDRLLLRLDDVPQQMLQALIAVEDRDFYNHAGVSIRSIGRAMMANLRAGRTVQGGSTLTQQLVKNYFLTNERSLSRKINEAIMAYLLDFHYSKDAILQAYLNEIYLGQDGRRAIHGVGLASQFYFGRSPKELNLSQQALMVAMLNGPSYYDPRRHPERARARRDLVLQVMREEGYITPGQAQRAIDAPLGVVNKPNSKVNRYPAFLDLVKRQLRENYSEADLRTEGLKIFTTLDPLVQHHAQSTVSAELKEMERYYGIESGVLQSAMIVTDTVSGEIQAVVGGRDPSSAGFNRALDAQRQIGSLIKPIVYLTALEQQAGFNLTSRLMDEPLSVELAEGKTWTPQNYDRISRGEVPAYLALVNSYNQASLQLGMQLGVDRVIATLRRLGVSRPVNIYPSFLLGATELTPIDVTQMYQTLANGGFTAPLRSINAVYDAQDQPLQRYELELEQAAEPGAVYQLNRALQLVAREGTAKALYERLPPELNLAGKTGTTDDLRDSWFSGFTGDKLAVVWLGRDDNKPAGFSGSTGAMRIWGRLFERIGAQSLRLVAPQGMVDLWLERETGILYDAPCGNSLQLPFKTEIVDTLTVKSCQKKTPKNWLEKMFGQ
ncbi:MAG: penicillin-binding protein 1B [Gammaproteobacteria bacterium]|nr:penicillin-binding protein 1B [Gammaproteobacteria bacterium]